MRHRLTVDAYMAQHPELSTPGSRRSVLTHLVGIHLALDRKMAPAQIGRTLAFVFPDKSAPPPEIGPAPSLVGISVAHVLEAKSPDEHDTRVEEWAAFVWKAWEQQHALVRSLAEIALRGGTKHATTRRTRASRRSPPTSNQSARRRRDRPARRSDRRHRAWRARSRS
jgi:hypothetical protein